MMRSKIVRWPKVEDIIISTFREKDCLVTKACVFVGPTRLSRIPRHVHVFAPAALGSVFRAIDEGYRLICLIDGYFGNTPSVWHKEILFALKCGVTVCGSSSIGALRAAELHSFGMLGFGWYTGLSAAAFCRTMMKSACFTRSRN